MRSQKYIGGNFSSEDSSNYKNTTSSVAYFLRNISRHTINGFETGADSLAFVLKNTIEKYQNKLVLFPAHYCQDTIFRIKLKVTDIQIQYYDTEEFLRSQQPGIIIWNHFNGFQPLPEFLKTNGWLVIEDAVQSIKAIEHFEGYAIITSFRKWLEIDLAIAISPFFLDEKTKKATDSEYLQIKKQAEQVKSNWQQTNQTEQEELYLKLFKEAEEKLHNPTIYCSDVQIINYYNWEELVGKRNQNAKTLTHYLQLLNIDILQNNELFVMISLPNDMRDKMRKELASIGIFAPIHWLDSLDKFQAKTLLSLPIDHRYNTSDMLSIANSITQLIES